MPNTLVGSVMFLLVVGVISGIMSSAPVGPANLWLATAVLPPSKPFENLVAYVVGIILIDICYAFIAFWGYYVYFQDTELGAWIGIVGGLGLVLLGVVEFRDILLAKKYEETCSVEKDTNWSKDFFVGAFLCGSNPVFVMFWLMVAKLVNGYGFSQLNNGNAAYIFLGIALGDALWYAGFTKMIKMGLSYISERFIKYVRIIVAALMIILGVISFVSFI